jgi:hypothetical protein
MALYKCPKCKNQFKEEPKAKFKYCGNCGSVGPHERVDVSKRTYKKLDSRLEARGVLRLRYP